MRCRAGELATHARMAVAWLLVLLSTAVAGAKARTDTLALAIPATVIGPAGIERVDRTHLVASWTGPGPADLYVTDRPDASIDAAKWVFHLEPGGHYLASQDGIRRLYFLFRDGRDGHVLRISERLLPLEHGSNFRDLGGYQAGGKHVRWGLIYRAAATPLLSDHDLRYLSTLRLRSVIDLRSTEERQLVPTRLEGTDIRYIAIDYPFKSLFPNTASTVTSSDAPEANSGYRLWLTLLAPQYHKIFNELRIHKGPIVVHCTAGQDRTGEAAALILWALGVPRATILEDYQLSTEYRRPQYEAPPLDPARFPGNPAALLLNEARSETPVPLYWPSGRSLLADAFAEIDARWGSVENYLQQMLGVDSADLAILRANYLE